MGRAMAPPHFAAENFAGIPILYQGLQGGGTDPLPPPGERRGRVPLNHDGKWDIPFQ